MTTLMKILAENETLQQENARLRKERDEAQTKYGKTLVQLCSVWDLASSRQAQLLMERAKLNPNHRGCKS